MKKIKKRALGGIAALLLFPATGSAFMGIGDSSDLILGKMLTELIVHTENLRNVLGGMNYLNHLQNDVRQGIDDPLNMEILGLPTRDEMTNAILQEAGLEEVPILARSVPNLKRDVEHIWGSLPEALTFDESLFQRDMQAIFSLSQAAAIQDESSGYFSTGQDLLDDLEGAREGKAAIRNAQASALQVQQLSHIEANQGLQISLTAQQILSQNEQQKGLDHFTHGYLGMLGSGFAGLKPMGPQ